MHAIEALRCSHETEGRSWGPAEKGTPAPAVGVSDLKVFS